MLASLLFFYKYDFCSAWFVQHYLIDCHASEHFPVFDLSVGSHDILDLDLKWSVTIFDKFLVSVELLRE